MSHDLNFLNSPSPFPERLISDIRRQSTPRALAASLGADSDSSEWSWSSSMATPPRPGNDTDLAADCVDLAASDSLDMVECAKYSGPARVLFSPGLALLQDSSLLVRTLPSDLTLQSPPHYTTSTTAYSDAAQDVTMFDDVMTRRDDVTMINDVRSSSDPSEEECPCTEPFEECPRTQPFEEYPCTEPFEPFDTGGVRDEHTVESVESVETVETAETKPSQVLREILAESGFGEVSRLDDTGAADVVVWMEGDRMDSRPKVEMEGGKEDSRPVVEMEGVKEDSRPVLEIEGAREDSRLVVEMEGAKEDSRPVVEMEGAKEDSRPVVEMEGAREDSRPVLEMEGAKEDSRPVVEMEGAKEDSRPVVEMEGAREDSRPVVEMEGAKEDSRPVVEMEDAREDSRPVLEMEGAREDSRPVVEMEGAQKEPDTLESFFGSPPPGARRAAPKRKRKRDSVTRSCDDLVAVETGTSTLVITPIAMETTGEEENAVTMTTTPVAKGALTKGRTVVMTTPEGKSAELDDPFSPLSPNVVAAMMTPPNLKRKTIVEGNAIVPFAVAMETVTKDQRTTPRLERTNLEMFSPISPRTLAALATTPSSSDVSMDTTFTQVSPGTLAAMVRETEKTCQLVTLNKASPSPSESWRSDTYSPASRDTSGYVSASLSSLITPPGPRNANTAHSAHSNANPAPSAHSNAIPAPSAHSNAHPAPSVHSNVHNGPTAHSNALTSSVTPMTEADVCEKTTTKMPRVESGNGLNRRQRKFAYPSVKQGTAGQPKRLFTMPAIDQGRDASQSAGSKDVSQSAGSKDIGQSTDQCLVEAPTVHSSDSVQELEKAIVRQRDSDISKSDTTRPSGVRTFNYSTVAPTARDNEVPSGCTGFSSASGRRITISDDALSKARSLLTDEDFGSVELGLETLVRNEEGIIGALGRCSPKVDESLEVNGGLALCSGEELLGRHSPLKKAVKLLSGVEVTFTDSNSSGIGNIRIMNRVQKGSNSSLANTNNSYIEPCDKSAVVVESYRDQSGFKDGGSFTSAFGRRIVVSQSAIKKANSLLSDVGIESNFEELPEKEKLETKVKSDHSPTNFPAALSSSTTDPPGGVTVDFPRSFYKTARESSDTSVKPTTGVETRDQARDKHVVNTWNSSMPIPDISVMSGFGFKSAGGKELKVSDESLKKANFILESVLSQRGGSDEKLELENNSSKLQTCHVSTKTSKHLPQPNTTGIPSCSNFSTAAGRNIQISAPALRKVEKLFEEELDIDQNGNNMRIKSDEDMEAMEVEESRHCDVRRVDVVSRTQDVDRPEWDITNTQMIRACSEFENESERGEVKTRRVKSVAKAPIQYSVENAIEFSASSEKRILTNTQILDASEEKMTDEIISENVRKCVSNIQPDGQDSLPRERESVVGESCDFFDGMNDSGFTQEILETTEPSNKCIPLSTESRHVPETRELETGNGNEEIEINGGLEEMEVSLVLDEEVAFEKSQESFSGFRTASGYQVTVSEEALLKVRETFMESGPITGQHDVISREESGTTSGHVSRKFAGFSSASGKTVVTSEKALRAVRGIFKDECLTEDVNHTDGKRNVWIQNETESGIANVQSEVEPCPTEVESERGSGLDGEVSKFCGFATASGKTVRVSDAALSKVREIFIENEQSHSANSPSVSGDSEHGMNNGDEKYTSVSKVTQCRDSSENREIRVFREFGGTSGFGGFSTAAGKKVEVSEEALLKVRGLKITEDSGHHGNHGDSTPGGKAGVGVMSSASSAFSGFCTAGGRKVDVTDEALARVRLEAPPSGGSMNYDSTDFNPVVFSDLGKAKVTSRNSGFTVEKLEDTSGKLGVTDEKALERTREGCGETFLTPFKTARGDSVTPTRGRGPDDPRLGPGGDANSEGMDNESETGLPNPDIRARLSQARFCQEQVVRKKRRQKIKPSVGRLLKTKRDERQLTLAEFAEEEEKVKPSRKVVTMVTERSSSVTSLNMEDYEFQAMDHYSAEALTESVEVCLEDGAVLVFSDQWRAGKRQFAGALLAMPHVDPALVCERWVFNHYGFIVWKLASLERTFPCHTAARFLTPSNVMLQLKYRYDREIDNSERSSIKKICEHDDTANKRMVLCVARLETRGPGTEGSVGEGTPRGETTSRGSGRTNGMVGSRGQTYCRLTDGWYSIGAMLDPAMESLVARGKVFIGQKLCLSGAELTNQDASSPLDVPEHVMLKVHTNSCRPCRWDAKLGYQADPRALCVPLSSLYAGGGLVGCVDVVILRRYPTLYRERMPDGSFVVRSEREEEKWDKNFTSNSEKRMEELYVELQKKYELQESRKSEAGSSSKPGHLSRTQLEGLDCGEDIHDAVMHAADPTTVETYLSLEQRRLLEDYRTNMVQAGQARLHEELQQLIENDQENMVTTRKVSPFVRFRVGGYSTRDVDRQTTMILNVHQVDDDTLKILQEGKRVKIFSATPVQSRGHPPADLHLHTSRATRFLPLPADDNKLDLVYEPRDLLTGSDARHRPAYHETDTIGVVVKVEPDNQSYANKRQSGFQTVYLADRHQQFLAVKFWGGLRSFHVHDVINVNDVVTVGNLSWRQNGSRYRPGHVTGVFVTDMTSFSTKIPEACSYRTSYHVLRKLNTPAFREECRNSLLEYLTQPRTPSSSWATPMTTGRDVTPMRAHDVTPVRSAVSCPGPVVERKQALQQAKARRLEYLEGSAPPLTPQTFSASQSVRKHFKSPFMSSQDSLPMDLVSSQEGMTSQPAVTSQPAMTSQPDVTSQKHSASTNQDTVRERKENDSERSQPSTANDLKSLVTSRDKVMTSSVSVTSRTPACRARASGLSSGRRRTVWKGEPALTKTQAKRSAKKQEKFRTPSKETDITAPRKLTYENAGEKSHSSVELTVDVSGENSPNSRERTDTTDPTLGNVVTQIKERKRKRGSVSKAETVALATVANVNKRQRRSSRLSRNDVD